PFGYRSRSRTWTPKRATASARPSFAGGTRAIETGRVSLDVLAQESGQCSESGPCPNSRRLPVAACSSRRYPSSRQLSSLPPASPLFARIRGHSIGTPQRFARARLTRFPSRPGTPSQSFDTRRPAAINFVAAAVVGMSGLGEEPRATTAAILIGRHQKLWGTPCASVKFDVSALNFIGPLRTHSATSQRGERVRGCLRSGRHSSLP